MKTKQLAFEFSRSFLKRFRAAPGARAGRDEPAETVLTGDPDLEVRAREMLREVGCQELAEEVRVVWNPRMRTTAGTACWRSRRVTLNPKLKEVSAEEVETTLRHELAHLVAQARAGRRRIAPHGAEWRTACADLGIAGEARCHSLPFQPRRMRRKYAFQCPQCRLVIRRVRLPKGRIACLACCRQHNRGRYSERFRLVCIPTDAR
ncbi:MAG: SprT family zinc-dependent metalloprotease [Chthoniobacterales bacterium]